MAARSGPSPGTDLAAATLASARAAVDVVGHPQVAAAWDRPSALPELTVGALASHIGQMVAGAVGWLEADPPVPGSVDVRPFEEVYATARLDPEQGLDSPIARAIRRRADDGSSAGPRAIAEVARRDLVRLRPLLGSAPDDRVVPSTVRPGLAMTLEDYLRTRCIEFVVHADDLAVSVDLAPPAPDPVAAAVAIEALIRLSRSRAGDLEVLRALARAERADPDSLRAL